MAKYKHQTPEEIITEFLSYAPADRAEWNEDPDELDQIPNVNVCAGCYRIALVPLHENFIIKIGFDFEGDEMNEQETKIYNESKKWNLNNFFAAPYQIVRLNGWNWYVFEKVELVGYQEDFPKGKCVYRDGKFLDWFYDQGKRWEPAFNYLSFTSGKKLFNFFQHYGLRDFHYGNFGYSKRLRHIVFTDYAGC